MATTSPATADHRVGWPIALLVLGASALGWVALLQLTSGSAPLCGRDATLISTMATWGLMAVTMMLPATLPMTRRLPVGEAMRFTAGYMLVAALPALVAAIVDWFLQTIDLMTNGAPPLPVQATLVCVAGLGVLRDTLNRRGDHRTGTAAGLSHLGACTAMAALQLAFGSMQPLLMAALTLWMLAIALCPWPLAARDRASVQPAITPPSAAVPA